MATIGIVGLGLLGSAVAARLRGGGHDVVGHDVVAEKVRALEALGGQAAPSAEEPDVLEQQHRVGHQEPDTEQDQDGRHQRLDGHSGIQSQRPEPAKPDGPSRC